MWSLANCWPSTTTDPEAVRDQASWPVFGRRELLVPPPSSTTPYRGPGFFGLDGSDQAIQTIGKMDVSLSALSQVPISLVLSINLLPCGFERQLSAALVIALPGSSPTDARLPDVGTTLWT